MYSSSRFPFLKVDISLLWPVIVLAAFAFYVSLVPLPPNDFWWHLKVGQLIYAEGAIPGTNIFAWTLPKDATFVYGAWFGELLFYLLYAFGKLEFIAFTRTILAVAAFWLVAVEAKRRTGSWRYATTALASACLMSVNNVIARPQIWSWLPFVSYLTLLWRYVDRQLSGKWLLICPLLMVLWVNAHGAFVLGIVLVGAFAVGELLRTWGGLGDALSWRSVGWLFAVALLCCVATMFNPRFVRIVSYVVDLMTDAPSQKLVMEWQTPTPTGVANTSFYVTILVTIVATAYSRYRLRPTEVFLTVGLLWLAWSGQRYVIWYALACTPMLAVLLSKVPVRLPTSAPRRNALNLLISVAVIVPVILVQPWFVERMPLPESYRELVLVGSDVGPLLDRATPVSAAAYLREHPGGNLFNEMGYGSYLIWAVPEQDVFVDPRVELYSYDQWVDYVHVGQGFRYNEILDAYGVDRILLDVKLQERLAGLLVDDPLWEMEFDDDRSQIWRKAVP